MANAATQSGGDIRRYVATPSSPPKRATVPTVARSNRFSSGRPLGFEGGTLDGTSNVPATPQVPVVQTTVPNGPPPPNEPGTPGDPGGPGTLGSPGDIGTTGSYDPATNPAPGDNFNPDDTSGGLGGLGINITGGDVGRGIGSLVGGLVAGPAGSALLGYAGQKAGDYLSGAGKGTTAAAPAPTTPPGTVSDDTFGGATTDAAPTESVAGDNFGGNDSGGPGPGSSGATESVAGDNFGGAGDGVSGEMGGGAGESGGGAGCFITEAVMSSGGQDGGPELEALRMFRDQVLSATPQGQALIAEYEAIAPVVVDSVMQRDDSLQIFQNLDAQYIMPAVQAVQAGDYKRALQIYAQMIAFVTPLAAESSDTSMPNADTASLDDFGAHAATMAYDHGAASDAVGYDPMGDDLMDSDPSGYDGGPGGGGPVTNGGQGGMAGGMGGGMAPPQPGAGAPMAMSPPGGGAQAFQQQYANRPRF